MQHLEVSGAVRHIYIYIHTYVIRRLKVNTGQSQPLIIRGTVGGGKKNMEKQEEHKTQGHLAKIL